MDSVNNIYEKIIIVNKNDIDELNHVNNVVYLSWVNEVAKEHWINLSTQTVRENCVWVALRHELDYFNAAFLGEELTVKTWVGESSGVKSIRFVEVNKGETLIASAKSTWCFIDAKSLRPARIPSEVLQLLH